MLGHVSKLTLDLDSAGGLSRHGDGLNAGDKTNSQNGKECAHRSIFKFINL